MKKKLVYVNKIPKEFIDCEEYVHEVIEYFFNSLDFDFKLKVEYVDVLNNNEFEISDCAVHLISPKNCKILITNSVLSFINRDGGEFFYFALFHEFVHIRDFFEMTQTKQFKFNLNLAAQKTYDRQCVSQGFHFWTEVYAYYHTICYSKENEARVEKIPFGDLVKIYIKTVELNKRLYYKEDLSYEEGAKYVRCVNSFVYLCAKFMASVYAGNSRIPRAKIDKDKNFKKVYQILCDLEPKVRRLLKDPYGSKAYDNLLKLGKYIYLNVRLKIFKVGLTRKHGTVRTIY